MKEASEQSVWLGDVDAATFACLAEFLYTGALQISLSPKNSDTPDPEPDMAPADQPLDEALDEPAADEPAAEPWASFSTSKKSKPRRRTKRKRQVAWEEFLVPRLLSTAPTDDWDRDSDHPQPKAVEYWLLLLAKAYVLADKYDIAAFRSLCFEKIHSLLTSTKHPDAGSIGDMVHVLEYVYRNTFDSETSTEDLRGLLSEYVVCRIEYFQPNAEFKDLMKGGTSLPNDVLHHLLDRMD